MMDCPLNGSLSVMKHRMCKSVANSDIFNLSLIVASSYYLAPSIFHIESWYPTNYTRVAEIKVDEKVTSLEHIILSINMFDSFSYYHYRYFSKGLGIIKKAAWTSYRTFLDLPHQMKQYTYTI